MSLGAKLQAKGALRKHMSACKTDLAAIWWTPLQFAGENGGLKELERRSRSWTLMSLPRGGASLSTGHRQKASLMKMDFGAIR